MNEHHRWLIAAAKRMPERETHDGWLQRIEGALQAALVLGLTRQ